MNDKRLSQHALREMGIAEDQIAADDPIERLAEELVDAVETAIGHGRFSDGDRFRIGTALLGALGRLEPTPTDEEIARWQRFRAARLRDTSPDGEG